MKQIRIPKILKRVILYGLPVVAISLSGYAIYIDDIHYKNAQSFELKQYEQLTYPHIQHQETLDLINKLQDRMERCWFYVNSTSSVIYTDSAETDNYVDAIIKVQEMIDSAEKAWAEKNYENAKSAVKDANLLLDDIPVTYSIINPAPGVVDIKDSIDLSGVISTSIVVTSRDGHFEIYIERGLSAYGPVGEPLSDIVILPMTAPPPSPEPYVYISPIYDIQPRGATFSEPIAISWNYSTYYLPSENVSSNLFVAYLDEDGTWVQSGIPSINESTKIINCKAQRFAPFVILYSESGIPVPPPSPIPESNWYLFGLGIVVVTIGAVVVLLLSGRGMKTKQSH